MADAAATLENLALVEKRLGKYDDALRRSVEALGQHRRNGDHARIALCLSNLGSFYMFLDRNDEAASCLNEALALSERHGLVSTRGFVLANLTELALKTRNLGLAQAHAERALEVAESSGMRALAGWLRVQLARLAAWNRDLGKAHALLSSGAEIALALDGPAIKAAAVLALADLLDALGKRPAALDVLAFGKDQLALSVPDRDELRAAWVSLGGQGRISPPWPGLTLDALIFRLVAEGGVSHAPLIAELSGSP
jgi:tetratricopeptide (TPR) repeat protein